MVMISDGRPSDTVADERYHALAGDDRIVTALSWRLRALEGAVDQRIPRFAMVTLGT